MQLRISKSCLQNFLNLSKILKIHEQVSLNLGFFCYCQSAKEMPIKMMSIKVYNRPYLKTVLGTLPYPLSHVSGYDVWQDTEVIITRIV